MTIERIFIRQPSRKSQIECEQVTLVAGEGIEGDRYFGHHDEPGQNVTLIEAEEIEVFIQEQGHLYDLSITNRNFITRDVRLNQLVGCEFLIGNVRLRGVLLCEPCESLGKSLASAGLDVEEVVKRFVHKAGLRADVVSGGVVMRGAKITPAE
jgi:MOSC domain-containing protein YiiM